HRPRPLARFRPSGAGEPCLGAQGRHCGRVRDRAGRGACPYRREPGTGADRSHDRQGMRPRGATEEQMEVELIIDGEARKAASGRTFARLNPVTKAVATAAPAAGKADVDRAVSAAAAAFPAWSKTGPAERRAL